MTLRDKRGVVEVQFNWIFILVSGALILSLFAAIVLKQKDVAEVSSHATLLKAITAITAGSEASSGVTSSLDLPEATIGIECNLIRIGDQSQQFGQMMLFSPTTLRTSPLIAKTQEWSTPYRVTNIVYLSSPKIRYILVGDTPLAREINKSMPKGLEAEWYPSLPSAIRPRTDDFTRFIFFGSSSPALPSSFSDEENRKITALAINGDSLFGTASFYSKVEGRLDLRRTLPYLKSEMLLGAVITDSEEQYECIAINMFRRLGIVSEIYAERTSRLASSPSFMRCSTLYTSAQSQISLIRAAGLNEGTGAQMGPAIASLETTNSQLQRQSCPLLY